MDGPATASELAGGWGVERRDELSPADPREGTASSRTTRSATAGRERWWRAVDEGVEWSLDTDDAGLIEADRELGRQLVAEYGRWLERWHAELPEWDRTWRAAATERINGTNSPRTSSCALSEEVLAVLDRYADRQTRRENTEQAIVLFHAFPQRRDAA